MIIEQEDNMVGQVQQAVEHGNTVKREIPLGDVDIPSVMGDQQDTHGAGKEWQGLRGPRGTTAMGLDVLAQTPNQDHGPDHEGPVRIERQVSVTKVDAASRVDQIEARVQHVAGAGLVHGLMGNYDPTRVLASQAPPVDREGARIIDDEGPLGDGEDRAELGGAEGEGAEVAGGARPAERVEATQAHAEGLGVHAAQVDPDDRAGGQEEGGATGRPVNRGARAG